MVDYFDSKREDICCSKSDCVFLFERDESCNHQGNYFDGEDPYREIRYLFYSFLENSDYKYYIEKDIWTFSDYLSLSNVEQHFKEMESLKRPVYENFAKKNPGKDIVVLKLADFGKDIYEEMIDAVKQYMVDGKSLAFVPKDKIKGEIVKVKKI